MSTHACPYCGGPLQTVHHGAAAYPYRKDYGPRLLCPPCDAHVGFHEGDVDRPLGTVANSTDRAWRRIIHNIIDPLWKAETGRNRRRARKRLYARLSDALGREAHASWENGSGLLELLDAARTVAANWTKEPA